MDKIRFAKLNALETHENQQIATQYRVMSNPHLENFSEGRTVDDKLNSSLNRKLIYDICHI